MYIKWRRILVLCFIFASFGFIEKGVPYRNIKNTSFTTSEKLEYRVHYGFLSAATASMEVSKKIYTINNRPCYKIDIHGRSSGLLNIFSKVNNHYGTYMDTAAMVPQRFYRYIEEGKYRKNEIIDFYHLAGFATVSRLDKKTKKLNEKINFTIPANVQDLVSGYYYLRTFDYSKFKPGEIFTVSAFFEDQLYDLRIKYVGKEKVTTPLGDFSAIVISPILPENKLFSGENAVKVWISDDFNKIPLKIKANLYIGALEIDIKSYKNTRN